MLAPGAGETKAEAAELPTIKSMWLFLLNEILRLRNIKPHYKKRMFRLAFDIADRMGERSNVEDVAKLRKIIATAGLIQESDSASPEPCEDKLYLAIDDIYNLAKKYGLDMTRVGECISKIDGQISPRYHKTGLGRWEQSESMKEILQALEHYVFDRSAAEEKYVKDTCFAGNDLVAQHSEAKAETEDDGFVFVNSTML